MNAEMVLEGCPREELTGVQIRVHRQQQIFGVSAAFVLSSIGLLGGNLFLLSFLSPSKMAYFISGSFLGNIVLLPGAFTGQYPSYLLSCLYPLPSHMFSKTTESLLQGNPSLPDFWRATSLKVTVVYKSQISSY